MRSTRLKDYEAFVAVAEAGSFRIGAAAFGVSASAMSQIVRRLEGEVGVQLIHRTTRSVSLTDAGARLLVRLQSAFSELETAAHELDDRRERPMGMVRILAPRIAYVDHIALILPSFTDAFPDVTIDVRLDDSFEEISAGGYDFGVRLGEYIHPDTVAVPIGPSLRQIPVASPAYIERYGRPLEPSDLLRHKCINWRQGEVDEVYAWEFARDGVPMTITVSGGLIINDREMAVEAARKGMGIALWAEHRLRPMIDAGELLPMLEDWSPSYPGFYLYYYRNRHMSSAAKAFLDAIRR
ncbi:DNA-binding transcriptional regulator, LysR family [Rhizobium sp. NFR07]|uniref:LysR family transcriptional regulator n=1 Tax=Rhizobium sp. NFR07 TaxID=1566262 RepID=UPI0008F22206|nr:LysR family transcriptional regulator [Rhizobium sp. NFR07]SFB55300.1 DNA-binding transcriptional regulator, LysR family [Rhizobium sp. NFR07]